MAKGIWLRQSSAAAAIGCGISKFGSSYKGKLKFKMEDGHKLYFVPLELMREEYQSTYQDKIIEVTGDETIDDLLTELNITADFDNSLSTVDIQEARRKKIIKETEYLDQKIKERKQQLFSEWSERFFIVFSKNFTKFKNSLIDLHLEEEAVKKLTDNLNLALNAMQESLDDILKEYMQEDVEDIDNES